MTEREIFLSALEIEDPVARQSHVHATCAGDPSLLAKVESLLTLNDTPSQFLNVPVVEQLADELNTDSAATELIENGSTQDEDRVAASVLHRSHPASSATSNDDADDEIPLGYLEPSNYPGSLGRLAHYEVLQVVGRGAFGIVLRALDDKLQRVVAIKVMLPELASTSPARKRFLREAQAFAAVRHEHVVSVYAVEEKPFPYLVMEFIPGQTLQQRLAERGPLDLQTVIRLGAQIAEGLAAAHSQELIHRDVKPGNILLESCALGKVKITDFGLARAVDDASLTQSGLIAGTPMYMAPEQVLGQKLDQRADLFSLGSVLYQMVSGRPPFRAPSTIAVLKRVVEETPRPIREIIPETPQWLCDIITKLHAKNPDERYQSAQEVADVLADCEAQLKANSQLKDFRRIPRSKASSSTQRKLFTAGAAICALLLLSGIIISLTNQIGTKTKIDSLAGTNVGINESLLSQQADQANQNNIAEKPSLATAPFSDAEVERIAALAALEQIEEVRNELKRRNPSFDGRMMHKIETDVVTELAFNTDQVLDIQPLRALTGLINLDLRGTYPNKGKLSDLSPLKGMKLNRLDCSSTQVSDLTPLIGVPLSILHFNHDPVYDLTPLKDMPLDTLGCAETKVSDLSPIRGMKIKDLWLMLLSVTDLSPLEGMPLKALDLYHATGVTNLEPLKGMPLEYLNLQDVPVRDISVLSGMHTLKSLHLRGNEVSDLNPLSGLNLTDLVLGDEQISDLSPLKGMPLVRLELIGTSVTDLTPLQGMPLKELRFIPKDITRGMEVLRSIKSLKTIVISPANIDMPPAEFWARYDQGDGRAP